MRIIMKKILVVMSTLYNGGAERSLVNFLNELPQDKYEIGRNVHETASLLR